ncbi:MAG: MoaD/ThiS family protein [Micropepsaceae bacterium]
MTVRVLVPQQLRNYTGGLTAVHATGVTVDDALTNVDLQFKGLKFRVIDEQGRIREHMRIFVDGARVRDVRTKVKADAEIHIFGALSGG